MKKISLIFLVVCFSTISFAHAPIVPGSENNFVQFYKGPGVETPLGGQVAFQVPPNGFPIRYLGNPAFLLLDVTLPTDPARINPNTQYRVEKLNRLFFDAEALREFDGKFAVMVRDNKNQYLGISKTRRVYASKKSSGRLSFDFDKNINLAKTASIQLVEICSVCGSENSMRKIIYANPSAKQIAAENAGQIIVGSPDAFHPDAPQYGCYICHCQERILTQLEAEAGRWLQQNQLSASIRRSKNRFYQEKEFSVMIIDDGTGPDAPPDFIYECYELAAWSIGPKQLIFWGKDKYRPLGDALVKFLNAEKEHKDIGTVPLVLSHSNLMSESGYNFANGNSIERQWKQAEAKDHAKISEIESDRTRIHQKYGLHHSSPIYCWTHGEGVHWDESRQGYVGDMTWNNRDDFRLFYDIIAQYAPPEKDVKAIYDECIRRYDGEKDLSAGHSSIPSFLEQQQQHYRKLKP